MQGDWTIGLDKLPTFKDGYPLSAESLRRIGHAQNYLNQRYSRFMPAQSIMQLETPTGAQDTTKRSMFFVHKHRYLIWKFRQDTALSGRVFRAKINGKRAVEINSGASPQNNVGTIDLTGNDLDGNAYGLTEGRAYEMEWSTVSGSLSGAYGMVFAYDTYESATSNSTLSLPASNPSFTGGGTPNASQLNNLATNCTFLLEENGIAHAPGYAYHEIRIPAPGGLAVDTSYQPHHHKYLAIRFDIDMGFYPNDITSTVYVNGASIYTDTKTKVSEGGGVIHTYETFLDVSGLGLATGVAYKVEVKANKSQWDDFTKIIVHYVGESPVNTIPIW